jgi:hypothetical protein
MIMDGQGNPSAGLTSAIGGGLRWIAQQLGLTPQQNQQPQGINANPQTQENRRAWANGIGATSTQTMNEVMDTIDPAKSLNRELRVAAGLEAVYKWHIANNDPEGANKAAASILMWSKQMVQDYGDEAVRRYYSGDMQGTVQAIKEGNEFLPNGVRLDGDIDQDGNVSVSGKKLNGAELWKMTVGPQTLLAAAMGMKDGTIAWQQLEQQAAKYDPQVKADLVERQQAAQAAQLDAAEKERGTRQGTSGGPPDTFKAPGSGQSLPINRGPPAPPAAPTQTAGGPPTTDSGTKPVLPPAPTGQTVPPPAQLSPAVAQLNKPPQGIPSPDASGQAQPATPPTDPRSLAGSMERGRRVNNPM